MVNHQRNIKIHIFQPYPGFVIVVVRLSKTTKNRHGQPNIILWNTLVVRTDNHIHPRNNFAIEHADIRSTVTRGTRQSSVISETWIMSAVMYVWLLTMRCGRNSIYILGLNRTISFLKKSLTCDIGNESVLKPHDITCIHWYRNAYTHSSKQWGIPRFPFPGAVSFIVFLPLPCHYDLCVRLVCMSW